MEANYDKILDSPSKNSYIGSYYQPPERILPMPRPLDLCEKPRLSSSLVSPSKSNIDSKAVVDALKTLQQKIRKLEVERMQAQKNYQDVSHNIQPAATTQPEMEKCSQKELDSKLQSAETRCKVLEKQLDYMKKMVESVKKERLGLMENQNRQPGNSHSQAQREKMEKLESECLKLSRTQAQAETKLAVLEQRLRKEEHERELVQEKADKLLEEMEASFRLTGPTTTEKTKAEKKTKKTLKKPDSEMHSPIGQRHQKIPFITGTSTSPSHSVHANMQSILHMMKHHQPQLCERFNALHRSGLGIRKNLQKAFPSSSSYPYEHDGDIEQKPQPLGSLSDLLLALQDELGQMSFEYHELVGQIDATQQSKHKHDLQKELERLVIRMEEKGTQITKLRKHQQMVRMLTSSQSCSEGPTADNTYRAKPPTKTQHKGNKGGTTVSNLQLLREAQKFKNRLTQDDLSWES